MSKFEIHFTDKDGNVTDIAYKSSNDIAVEFLQHREYIHEKKNEWRLRDQSDSEKYKAFIVKQ